MHDKSCGHGSKYFMNSKEMWVVKTMKKSHRSETIVKIQVKEQKINGFRRTRRGREVKKKVQKNV